MKKLIIILLSLWLLLPTTQYAQTESLYHDTAKEHHSQTPHFRGALLMGHTLITPGNTNTRLFVPSWGLDLEYWGRGKWGLGLHTDVEVQDFVVLNDNEEEIQRNEPLILTLDGLYSPVHGLVLLAGPGLAVEEGEHAMLVRVGVEYEVPLGKSFDLFPTIFYDWRFDDYATLTVGLGVGKAF
ncbi:hypothetical protein [Neolewinella agarilytica]|uniref:Outer membrane protein beta-barrel domain-containing protein n=1 Tax=Neolewinella agarilytica TaxID=478744 RepID=A0A1H9P5U2_9BACT|nr:hypothetical protein [Neolewinella agarilytica]SER43674.1 hypothetical protein SAMN05444359_14310 [Neolewinella agarilytica]